MTRPSDTHPRARSSGTLASVRSRVVLLLALGACDDGISPPVGITGRYRTESCVPDGSFALRDLPGGKLRIDAPRLLAPGALVPSEDGTYNGIETNTYCQDSILEYREAHVVPTGPTSVHLDVAGVSRRTGPCTTEAALALAADAVHCEFDGVLVEHSPVITDVTGTCATGLEIHGGGFTTSTRAGIAVRGPPSAQIAGTCDEWFAGDVQVCSLVIDSVTPTVITARLADASCIGTGTLEIAVETTLAEPWIVYHTLEIP